MRWGRNWPEKQPRPKVRRLTAGEQQTILAEMTNEIARSPVLSGFGVQVRSERGRFYIDRITPEGIEDWGRITPLADELLLEVKRRSWSEIAKGSSQKLIKVIAGDTKGTFHGLGWLDKSLRKSGRGLERRVVKKKAKFQFVYSDTGAVGTAQEALFHYFGLPLEVIAEPAVWYSYHRVPKIVEANKDRTRVLVRFSATSSSGEDFGGTCLYAEKKGSWGAYRIRPSASQDIDSAEAWLVKRKWESWR